MAEVGLGRFSFSPHLEKVTISPVTSSPFFPAVTASTGSFLPLVATKSVVGV